MAIGMAKVTRERSATENETDRPNRPRRVEILPVEQAEDEVQAPERSAEAPEDRLVVDAAARYEIHHRRTQSETHRHGEQADPPAAVQGPVRSVVEGRSAEGESRGQR